MKKNLLLAAGAIIVIIGAAITFAVTVQTNNPAVAQSNSRLSVREKARQKGQYVGTIRPAVTTRYDDIESLARASTIIVTGLVQQQQSFVPANNERIIATRHQVIIQQVLRGGEIRTGELVTVETLGGKIQFDNGSTAEMKTPAILKDPQLGKSYMFFLRPHKSNYRLVGGPQGLFEIDAIGRIKAQVAAGEPLARKHDNQTLDQLATVVRQAIGQP